MVEEGVTYQKIWRSLVSRWVKCGANDEEAGLETYLRFWISVDIQWTVAVRLLSVVVEVWASCELLAEIL